MSRAKLQWLCLVAAWAGIACGPNYREFREEVREHTYPRDFKYMERDEIRGAMAQLAVRVYQLEATLAAEPEPDRARAATLLREMHAALDRLGSGGWPSNHPGFASNAEQLAREVERALLHVEHDPPSYFWAGTVSAACLRCHGRGYTETSATLR